MRREGRITKTIAKAVAIALSFSIIFGTTLGSYADELNTINDLLTEAGTDIDTAEGNEVDFAAIVVADTAQVNEELTSFDVSANVVDTQSDAAIADAATANKTSDEKEAVAAKKNAEAELANAETALDKSNKTFENAQNNFNSVSANYAEANNTYNTAIAALNDVSANTVAAEQALEAAKALIDVEEIKKGKLEDMEEQYYGLMVQYYRSILGNNTVYVDGKLDVSANAGLLTENQINSFAKNGDATFFKYGRYLTKELVEYMIINREDVSFNNEENEFTYGTTGKGQKQEGQEAVIFSNDDGNDQAKPGKTETYIWNRTNYNSGRGNSVEVTYKDKDGVLRTEHYNYVIKSSEYDDELDMKNGMIYLALVELGEDNKYHAVAVSDNDNNYSDYTKLTEAVAAYQVLDTYTQAYEEAVAKVEALKATYATLSADATATKAQLDTLKAALDTASEALADAEAKKEEVTAKYEEAKKAVAGIDLSRFAVVPVTVAAPAEEAPAEEPAEEPAVIILPAAAPIAAAPVVAAPAGEEVEEIEEVNAEVIVDEDDTPLSDGPEITEEETVVEEEKSEPAEVIAEIEGDEVPLAGFAFTESLKKVWWIWILIALTVVTMYLIYKRNAKKENN